MTFNIDDTHSERVNKTVSTFENSEFNWSVERLDNKFSADLIAKKEDVYPEPEFAIVVSAGNTSSALRKMNPFKGTEYYWAFAPCRDREIVSVQRDWFRGLGVALCDVTADKAEMIVNYSNNDAKLPIDYSNYKYSAEERLDRLGWDSDCLEKLDKKYRANTRAFLKGDGDPNPNKDSSRFNFDRNL